MNCNNCKNPVNINDSSCEWCGQKLDLYQSNIEEHPLKIFQNSLLELEIQARKDFSSNFGSTKKAKKGLFGDIADALLGDDSDASPNPNSKKANRYVYNLKAQAVSKFILPSNPEILKELVDMAVTNYKLNKVSFWDDESKSNEAQKKLSEAWLALSKRAKKKLGEKDSGINIGSFFNFKK